MVRRYAPAVVCVLLALLLAPRLHAQEAERPAAPYATERHLIETTLETLVTVIQEITFQNTGQIGERLRHMALRLDAAAQPFAGAAPLALPLQTLAEAPPADHASAAADLARLRQLLYDVHAELAALRDELQSEDEYDLADRLAPLERSLSEAVFTVDAMVRREAPSFTERHDGWQDAAPPYVDRYDDHDDGLGSILDDAREGISDGLEGAREGISDGIAGAKEGISDGTRWIRQRDRERNRTEIKDRDRIEVRDEDEDFDDGSWRRPDRQGYVTAHVGELWHRWPYHETALYRPIPAIRYNRVEGLVLGIGSPPLDWGRYDRSNVYGQLSYAFALDRWRYEIGLETRPGRGYVRDFGFKVGGVYRRNTYTNDLWKSSWAENSLGAFFFENDFFDYYEIEGWSVYSVFHLTRLSQFSAGYRSDEYRTLERETGWSLFDGDGFRENPAIDDTRLNTFVFAYEGGRVRGFDHLPSGGAFRAEAEVGKGLGNDFAFNRYEGDLRLYTRLGRYSSLSVRLRGGLADGDVPLQKMFDLGGVGSVRAYPQNAFRGTRMLLGNAEYAIDDVSLFDDLFSDLQVFGFFDAGWVNAYPFDFDRPNLDLRTPTNAFDADDVLPAAGLGIGLDDRQVRLELAWPLRDAGFGLSPSLWLRLNPTF